ncbi:hypothetical protein BC937DRAFT_92566 [Endogone sp. FLAS-F59071]|nr:hypothetical protein BC937DRAFT_92566 [Endogone sp. FLAS-F59071]|eukprot:RUS15340.1 hypothetical protein BC937DRAFT_92566 [Endogone sp. FLAS-F59071]
MSLLRVLNPTPIRRALNPTPIHRVLNLAARSFRTSLLLRDIEARNVLAAAFAALSTVTLLVGGIYKTATIAIEPLKAEVEGLQESLQVEMKVMEAGLRSEMTDMKAGLHSEIVNLRSEMVDMKAGILDAIRDLTIETRTGQPSKAQTSANDK